MNLTTENQISNVEDVENPAWDRLRPPFSHGNREVQDFNFSTRDESRLDDTDEVLPHVPPVVTMAIYPAAALNLLKLKCPMIRSCTHAPSAGQGCVAVPGGLVATLANFDGGEEQARLSAGSAPGYDEAEFNAAVHAGRSVGSPVYTCANARADGSTRCPSGGCPLPDGKIAETPTDLLLWSCNIKEVNPITVAHSVSTSEFGDGLIRVREDLFGYDEGYFRKFDQKSMYGQILPHLGMQGSLKMAKEVHELLGTAYARGDATDPPSRQLVCFTNGMLNVETGELLPHDPAQGLKNRIGHAYDPQAQCPNFHAFLRAVWAPDADIEQKIAFTRQWMGYLLVPDVSQQKMLILKGGGANGKSVLMDIVRAMIGEANTTSAMLDRLRQPYVRATLERMLLNQSADLPKLNMVSDGDLKAIISGDTIEASPKHKPSYAIKPYSRLMVATNNMPASSDTTEGYFRRLIVLSFNREFATDERNPHLFDELLQEMPGIIAWAVGGLQQLRAQGQFTIPASSEQAVANYKDDLSPVRMFAEECLTHSRDRTGYVPRDLFMAFRAWCRHRGFDAGNMTTLGRELASLGYRQRKSNTTWWLVGITAAGEEYFKPAQVTDVPATEPSALNDVTNQQDEGEVNTVPTAEAA